MRPSPHPIAELRRGQHACLLYDDPAAAIAAVAPFVAAGLAAGERCVYVLGEHPADAVKGALAAAGIEVAAARERGALLLVDRWQATFPGGRFEPAAMIGYVRGAIDEALTAGFSALRVVAEMSWALRLGVGRNKLIHYEALGNGLYPDEPLVAICLYDRGRFPAAVCQDALRVHPFVAVDGTVFNNVYYDMPPGGDARGAAQRVEWMLAQLRRFAEADRQRRELLEVRAARKEAEAALAARDELLATLAHELRTPLAVVRAQVEALRELEPAAPAGAGPLRAHLDGIAHQVRRQSKLIEQVMAAVESRAGALVLDREPCELAPLVERVVAAARATAPGHRFVVRAASCPPLLADPLRVEQVLTNLVDNAVKFSPPGSAIEVELSAGGEAVALSVRDHGPGVPADRREVIFERYERGAGSGGLGLGLYVSREIVRRHGGELVVEEVAGGGSRFVARLPLPERRPAAPMPPRTGARPALGERRARPGEGEMDRSAITGTGAAAV